MARICFGGCKDINPGIVKIPTDMKSDYGIAALANSITLTPGTITMDFAEEDGQNYLYVHWIDQGQPGERRKEVLEMTDMLIFSIFFAVLAAMNLYRLAKGPNAADRMVAGDAMDTLICCAMILFSLFSGRGIYLDIAVLTALFGIIDTIVVGRYLEGGKKK